MTTHSAFSDTRAPDGGSWFMHRSGVTPAVAGHTLGDVLGVLGAPSDVWADRQPVGLTRVRSGSLFCHEGATADALHVVHSGSFKCLKTAEDGYEQVLAFVARGELLGFESLAQQRLPMSVVALEDSSVLTLPLRELDGWRRQSPQLDHALMRALGAQLLSATEVTFMMAAVAAEVRLARFLVWMSARMARCGQSPRNLRLRMNRREIASLLAMAHETASRGFKLLAERGLIEVDIREVKILDMDGLKATTVATRREAEEHPAHPARHPLPARERPARPALYTVAPGWPIAACAGD